MAKALNFISTSGCYLKFYSELFEHLYLILFIPAEVVPGCKLLRPLHHKVD